MTADAPLRLAHYTCAHCAPLIAAAGMLRPNPAQTLLPEPVIWATDLQPGDVPELDLALGLRGQIVRCDRTECHFEVTDPALFEPWTDYVRRQIRAGRMQRRVRESLDATPGGLPRHWFLTTVPVPVRPSPITEPMPVVTTTTKGRHSA
jgi:hypothetical protein